MKLVVVLVRNLAAHWLGAYGNEWVATPNLDRLAAEGIVFERHIAERLDNQSVSYAPDRKRFDDLVPPWDVPLDLFRSYANASDVREPLRMPGPVAADDLNAWDAARFSYAAVLTRLDARLGDLFRDCRSQGATIVLTSDQGFPLGEHGTVGPESGCAHVERVHLPLILGFSDGSAAGERVDRFTQPTPVWTAITATLRNSAPEQAPPTPSEFLNSIMASVCDRAITRSADNQILSIRTDEWTYLAARDATTPNQAGAGSAKLYEFPADRMEQCDLADRMPDIVLELADLSPCTNDYSIDQD